MMGQIYIIENIINNKLYVGKTQYTIKERWKSHISDMKRNKGNSKLYNAITKYGIDNFTWEPIYQSKDGEHCLSVMESYFINEYDSFNNGYNLTLGGEGSLGRPTPETTKLKISQALKNKPKSNPQLNRAQNFHDSRSKSQGNMTPEMMHSAYNQTGSFGGA